MAVLDWIFLAVLLASMLIGAWRGLVFEVLSALGWLLAFVAAQWWADDVAAWLPLASIEQAAVRYAAGFAVVFVMLVFACGGLRVEVISYSLVVMQPLNSVMVTVYVPVARADKSSVVAPLDHNTV